MWYDLVSFFGGVMGIMLGSSIITFVEYLYFQTGRFGLMFLKHYWGIRKTNEKLIEYLK